MEWIETERQLDIKTNTKKKKKNLEEKILKNRAASEQCTNYLILKKFSKNKK